MAARKRSKIPGDGFCFDPKTGKIDQVFSITKSTLDDLQTQLNTMHKIVKACSKWEHSPGLDKRITKYLETKR